jgi:hypothetical protein
MSVIRRNWVHHNGWQDRPGHARPGDGTPDGDGSHGPGGIYLDNGSTGWNCTENVFENITVWALACYTAGVAVGFCSKSIYYPSPFMLSSEVIAWTTGIDNNSFTMNTAVCAGWCGPLGPKVPDCEIANNSVFKELEQLSARDHAVIASAGPRTNGPVQ